ncbi:UNVERIFIED_CONTAM: hypothetical protein Sradi_3061000 [Sesamum radiatum]|uniref:Uncharacterized protein n=1 Tax=Sesamum radiatum TaxID=300843 RepID=A0AAW2RBH8_SESRA
MSGVLEMYTQCTLRDQELHGSQCQETGAKTGRAIHTSMDKASLSRSPRAMAEAWSRTTLLHPTGLSGRHSPELNSARLVLQPAMINGSMMAL